MTFLTSFYLFPVLTSGPHFPVTALSSKSRSQQTDVLLTRKGKLRQVCLARILFRAHLSHALCTCVVKRSSTNVKAECGAAGSAKNILRIGFDSSTENRTLFKRDLRKKLSCTIRG